VSSSNKTIAHPAPETGNFLSERHRLVGIGLGHALEWYDWGAYAVFAPYFAAQFFPTNGEAANDTTAMLSTLAVFAVGFVARPAGGVLFGVMADRHGRRSAMSAAVSLMAAASFVVGVTPSYEVIGVWAPIILVVSRLVQGAACGGELPAAQTYLSEIAPKSQRGRWSSLIYIASVFGNTLGIALGLLMTLTLTDVQLRDWAWRVPFLLGGVLGLVTMYMRRAMPEPEVFTAQRVELASGERPRTVVGAESGSSRTIRLLSRRRQSLQVSGLSVGFTVTYYVWIVSTPAYAISTLGLQPVAVLTAAVGAALCFMAMMPAWGALSDRIGRRPVLLVSVIGSAMVQFPLSHLIRDNVWWLFVCLLCAMIPLAAGVAILPAVYAEMFPVGIRASGMALPYSLTVALFGGTAPYLQQWIGRHFGRDVFNGYTVLLLTVTAVTVLSMNETAGKSLAEED
jgi:MFS transporter, MHS family, alpha-ketoglutarate permease